MRKRKWRGYDIGGKTREIIVFSKEGEAKKFEIKRYKDTERERQRFRGK